MARKRDAKGRFIGDSSSATGDFGNDQFVNLASGLGTKNDPSVYRGHVHLRRDLHDLEALYRTNWLAGQVVEVPAFEMTRATRKFLTDDAGLIKQLSNEERRVQYWSKVGEAIQWKDLHGGAGLLLGVEGQGDLDKPLDVTRIREGDLKFIHALDRRALVPDASDQAIEITDPTSEMFMRPAHYMLGGSPKAPRVHHSRVIRFPGIPLPWFEMAETNYWGGSRLERLWDPITNAQEVMAEVVGILRESRVDIVKVKGLISQLQDSTTTAQVIERFREFKRMQSNSQIAVVDMDAEEHSTKESALVQGLAPIIETFLVIVASASDIPVTRLLGTSAKGLSATGEGDLRNYYDMIDGRREQWLRFLLDQLDEVFLRSATGRGPDEFEWKFGDLYRVDEAQQAEIDAKKAETHQKYIDMDVIDEIMVATDLMNEGRFGIDQEYIEELKSLIKTRDDDAEEARRRALESGDPEDPEDADPEPDDPEEADEDGDE